MPQKLFGGYLSSSRNPTKINSSRKSLELHNEDVETKPKIDQDLTKETNAVKTTLVEIDMFNKAKKIYKSPYQPKTISQNNSVKSEIQVADISSNSNNLSNNTKSSEFNEEPSTSLLDKDKLPSPKSKMKSNDLNDGKIIKLKEPHMIYQNPDEYYRNTEKKGCKMLMPQTKTNISKLKAQNQLKIRLNNGVSKPKKTPKVVLYNVFTDRALLKQVSVNTNDKVPENELPNAIDDASFNEVTCNWLVGDLVWARLSTYPWWPSMITYDPCSGVFTRIKKKSAREFHVQFFGENARAWVNDKNLLKFEEPLAYKDVLKLVESHTGTPSKIKLNTSSVGKNKNDPNNTSLDKLEVNDSVDSSQIAEDLLTPLKPKETLDEELTVGVPSKFRLLWTKGLGIAEKAITLNRVERRQTLTIDFPVTSRSANSKPRSSSVSQKKAKEMINNHKTSATTSQSNEESALNSSLDTDQPFNYSLDSEASFDASDIPSSHSDAVTSDPSALLNNDPEMRNIVTDLIESSATTENSHKRPRKLSSKFLEYKLLPLHKKPHSHKKEDPLQHEIHNLDGSMTDSREKNGNAKKETENRSGEKVDWLISPKKEVDDDGCIVDVDNAATPNNNFKSTDLSSLVHATNRTLTKPSATSPPPSSKYFNQTKQKKRKAFPLTPKAAPTKRKTTSFTPPPHFKPLLKVWNDNKVVQPKPSNASKSMTPIGTKKKIGNIPMVGDLEHSSQVKLLMPTQLKVEPEENLMSDNGAHEDVKNTTEFNDGIVKGEEERQNESQSSIGNASSTSNGHRGNGARYHFCFVCKTLEATPGPRNSANAGGGGDSFIECTSKHCSNTYHRKCLGFGSTTPANNYICDECATNKHPCFVCKSYDGDLERCMVAACGKYFHKACISRYPLTLLDTKGVICPCHQCASCISDNAKNPKATRGKFYRCILCPCTYHASKDCVAAGSLILSDSTIICSDHNQPENHLNVGWCFICSKGDGNLFCCDSCPAAFHHSCLPGTQIPLEGVWWCPDCESGKRPVYADVVWIKLTSYRWWPGRVCNPELVPASVREKGPRLRDLPGHFPVYFFGSKEYYWINRTRVFLFADGDTSATQESSSSQGKSLNKIFTKALQEAAEEFEKRKEVKQERLMCDRSKMGSSKPRPFKMIKSNKPVGNVQIYHPTASDLHHVLHACNCSPDEEDPCGDDSTCLNRISLVECHPKICKAGPRCGNQRFIKRQYPPMQPFLTPDNRGWGLMAMADIKKGEFINEYVGELIDEAECLRRIEISYRNNIDDFYFLTIDKDRIIDAGPKGNLSRFMNHHCQPNMETQKWTVNGDVRVGLFAIKDIPKGSELVFNYNFDCLGNEKKKCHCGASNCSGYMGVRPPKIVEPAGGVGKRKYTFSSANGNSSASAKRSRPVSKADDDEVAATPQLAPVKCLDTECFVCCDVGELISCDKATCTKVYHLTCVGLSSIPQLGKWTCPRHLCSACGAGDSETSRVIACDECPVSFCCVHVSGGNMLKITNPTQPETPIILCCTANQTHKRYLTQLIDVQKMKVDTYQSS